VKTIRHNTFETNSSSTHSFSRKNKEIDWHDPTGCILVRQRNMEYLYKLSPEYLCVPEYSILRTMTTNEVIAYVFNNFDDIKSACSTVMCFLKEVSIPVGHTYREDWFYGKKQDKAVKLAENIKNTDYPQFDVEIFAPENDFVKKLEFLYAMALGTEGGYYNPVSYADFYKFLQMINTKGLHATFYIESYEGSNVLFGQYEEYQHKATVAALSGLNYYESPLYMELHEDTNAKNLKERFKTDKQGLVDWVFDNNSGFYRYRNG